MKTKAYLTIASIILVAFAAVLWVQSCRKSVDPLEITNPTTKLLLRGKVIDKTTKLGIANAIVTLEGIGKISTNNEGIYTKEVDITAQEEIVIYANASGYGTGSTKAIINDEQISVNTISLKKLNPPVTIGPSGGKIEVSNNEGIQTNTISLTIPPNAFNSNVDISVTPYEGIEVPGKITDARLNLSTASINSGGVDPLLPVFLEFPMPIIDFGIDSLPLLYFNENDNKWENTGKYAIINNETNTATAAITHFSTYSLAIYGRYVEEISQTTPLDPINLDRSGSVKTIPWLAKVEYPNGIPNNTSANWLKNVVSQNTELGPGRVSFFDSTYTTINYVGYKPDSTNNSKSTNCVNWIWVPMTCGSIIIIIEHVFYSNYWLDTNSDGVVNPNEMFVWIDNNENGTVDEGELNPPIIVPNYVYKEMLTFCGYWRCVHDQGGGK